VETIGFNGKTIAWIEMEGLKIFEKEVEAMMRTSAKVCRFGCLALSRIFTLN